MFLAYPCLPKIIILEGIQKNVFIFQTSNFASFLIPLCLLLSSLVSTSSTVRQYAIQYTAKRSFVGGQDFFLEEILKKKSEKSMGPGLEPNGVVCYCPTALSNGVVKRSDKWNEGLVPSVLAGELFLSISELLNYDDNLEKERN